MDYDHRRNPCFPFYKLESETSALSNEDTESVNSFQDLETDLVRDSSDTENFGSEYEVEIEYEVESMSGSDLNSLIDSEDSDVEKDMLFAAAAAICDSSFEKWVTDGEDSDITSSEDNSYNRTDFWICVKCKSQKNNPLFRYCEKCFQDRKTLFPPRPKPRKPKKNVKKPEHPVKIDALRSCLKGLSQDSGLGSSQECPPLGLDKIVIPEHLTVGSSAVLSSNAEDDVIPSSQPEGIDRPSTSKQVTLNDIVKTSRKRQLSESSLSDGETKRPRWRDIKKSPKTDQSTHSLSVSPSRKRKSTSCERDSLIKRLKCSDQLQSTPNSITASEDEIVPQKTISTNGNSASQESIDVGKTSDLGSEISSGSGSGIFYKTEDLLPVVVDSKEICIFCNTTPINAGFLHGNIAHRCCCYTCAKKTWKAIKRCPMCNRKVNKVIRVY